jgi:hypothetical protein
MRIRDYRNNGLRIEKALNNPCLTIGLRGIEKSAPALDEWLTCVFKNPECFCIQQMDAVDL